MRAVVVVASFGRLTIVVSGTRPAFAQERASAGIYGSVTDSQGTVVPGATVTLLQVATNQVRTAITSLRARHASHLRYFAQLPRETVKATSKRPRILKSGMLLSRILCNTPGTTKYGYGLRL